jgi:hypothetical protein
MIGESQTIGRGISQRMAQDDTCWRMGPPPFLSLNKTYSYVESKCDLYVSQCVNPLFLFLLNIIESEKKWKVL